MISNHDKEKLLTYSKNVNAIVVNSGIDENLLKLKKINVDKYSIFHIGSLNWYPNLDGLMWFLDKILPKIISKEPRSKLFIYGSRLPENILLKNEIKNHVVNVGFVENLWNEIKDKQIAIVPLRIGSGIRIKILELLASSNIVVTTSLGAEGIGLTNKKNILIADDANMFAGEILKLFNDKYEIEEMIELSKNYIEQNYSWNVIAKKIETELNNLI
ncbi:MAG: glycosyltransferase family 4 protein [Stygiobacter sp.]